MLMMAVVTFAQTRTGQVFGSIQDNANHGLPFVSIEIYTKGEVQDLVSGGMTDENGKFIVDDVLFGEYEFVITAIGFADKGTLLHLSIFQK